MSAPAPVDADGARRLRVLALATYPVEAASSRYRVVQLIAPLASRGIDVTFSPFLDGSLFAALYEPAALLPRLPRLAWRVVSRIPVVLRAAAADVVLVQREALLFGPPVAEWLTTRLLRRPLVLDLDDATYLPYPSPVYGRLASWLKQPRKTDRLIDWARVVACGNPTVAAHVRARGRRAVVVAAGVDLGRFRPAEPAAHQPPTVGWIGTHGTYPFLARLLPLLAQLAREQPFRLRVVGASRAEVQVPGVEVESLPWRLDREEDDFRRLDVGLYPLPDDAWSAGKSGLKAVQYMASGVPFVMSPVGICAEIGLAGETHLPARRDEEWLAALRRLLTDGALRRRMGQAGRAYAEAHCSLEGQADAMAAVLRAAAGAGFGL